MACKILETKDGSAIFYCSSSMWAFGPVMESVQEAEAFAKWLKEDPRGIKDHILESRYYAFKQLTLEQKHSNGLCEILGIECECPECQKATVCCDECSPEYIDGKPSCLCKCHKVVSL